MQQQQDGDCLPACTYMVLSYLGKRIRYRRLRRQLNTQDFGTSFFDIRQLNVRGISVEADKRGTFELLYQHLSQNHPPIVSVQTEHLPHWGFNTLHAVVLVGMIGETCYINDPEFPEAPLAVSQGDLDLAWLAQDERYAVLLP